MEVLSPGGGGRCPFPMMAACLFFRLACCYPSSASAIDPSHRLTMQGVAYLHDMRILHRDIKPSNVLLDADSNAKVGDLGFGRLMSKSRWLP